MRWWIDHMPRHAGLSVIIFSLDFFGWLHRQFIMINAYPYACMDFHDDSDLVLPKGEEWGALGKKFQPFKF